MSEEGERQRAEPEGRGAERLRAGENGCVTASDRPTGPPCAH